MSLQNVSLGARVAAVFFTIAFLTGAMTLLVAHNGAQLAKRSHDIRERQHVAVYTLADMQRLTERFYTLQGHIILAKDTAAQAELRAKADRLLAEYDALDRTLRQSTTSESEKKSYDAVDALWRDIVHSYKSGPQTPEQTEHAFDNLRREANALEELQHTLFQRSSLAVDNLLYSMRRGVMAMQIVIIAAIVAGFFVITRSVSSPVQRLTAQMMAMSEGALENEVPHTPREDEIGHMARALEVLRRGSLKAQNLAQEKINRADKIEKLLGAFDTSVTGALQTVAAAATELESTAAEMDAVARETGRQAQSARDAGALTSSGLKTTAGATEEINAALHEVARQAAHTSKTVDDAMRQTHHTHTIVSALEEAGLKIGDIVKVISDIAEQTNLLALNAAIEAARAGDAGRGFAVVAAEVKSLAGQTARATQDISAQIEGMQGSTKEATKAIRVILGTVETVQFAAASIAGAVEEQTAAASEIAKSTGLAATSAKEVADGISGLSHAALRTDSAAAQLLSAAGALAREAETLKARVDRFFRDIRSA